MAKLNVEQLKKLKSGALVIYAFKLGVKTERYPAKLHSRNAMSRRLVIHFSDSQIESYAWSLTTNKPTGQFAGHYGECWLEDASKYVQKSK